MAVHLLLFLRLSCKANCSAFLYGQAIPVKKKWKVLFVIVNTTAVQTYQELHSELTSFFCLTGFSLPSVLFTPVLPLCRPLSYVSLNHPGKHCSSLPVQAKHSTPKLPTVGLLA